jgi:glycosyltransferase involved in cell wall biosynthesis
LKTVAIVVNTSWNIFNFRLGLLTALHKNGYKIIVIAPNDEYSNKFKSFGFEYHNIAINGKGTHPVEDIRLIYNIYKIYKKVRPDVVLHYTIKPNVYGTIAASLLDIPVVNNIAGLGTLFVRQDFITKIAKMLYKFSQARANHIFFQNNDDLDQFTQDGLVDSKKCDVLPGSGIDTNKYLPREKINSKKIVFLLIARMLWEKGVGEYVEAARVIKSNHKSVEFQLLGFLDVDNRSAISKEQMQEWVDEGVINYLGTTDDVPSFIAKADCIVLPSFYREGTPRSLLESASMSKPIITTDNVGCKDVVDDGVNGYLCKVRNSNDLASKMGMFLGLSDKEKDEMGDKGRVKMVARYDESIVIGKYLNAIDEVLK